MRLSDYSQPGGRGLFRRDRRLFDQRGTFTFTIPDGVTKVWAFSMGAGGGAAVYSGTNAGMVGGGKGGGYASGIISGLTPGNTLTLTVGSGGVGEHDSAGTSATAGGNSTVVGGSTTYLQGNGGGAGVGHTTTDPGAQKGQGGSASTNNVTDAYTAAGGGSGSWYIQQEADESSPSHRIVTGGGTSGSPFGTGMGGGKSVGLARAATGGGGWTQRDFEHSKWVIDSAVLTSTVNDSSMEIGLPGYGSHTPPQFFFMGSSFKGRTSVRGGNGRTAKGKSTVRPSQWGGEATDSGTASYNDNYPTDALLNFQSYLDGEDGNPHWWFPWEIDGGGGAGIGLAASTVGHPGRMWVGGDGGTGAGGGGIFIDGSFSSSSDANSQCISIGGNGGFGAGGGGSFTYIYDDNQTYDHSAVGGNGGNGGGGGGAWARAENTSVGGNGGDGCIGIYW